jgi:serine phosphatase RsbU (regulator of sigma subunit)
VEIGIRYLPGVNGIEIGGDWYDVIAVDDTRFFFAVGDVSGRGLEAGSVMASLHYAIRAFVSEGHDAATVLTRLGRILSLTRDRHFATVLCGYADVAERRVTIANAGHLPPLVVAGPDDGSNRFVTTGTGPPIGVTCGAVYEPISFTMDERCVLLVYTDGLVERRGENLDEGLERLRASASAPDTDLDAFLDDIVGRLGADGSSDDTALLALRWTGARK